MRPICCNLNWFAAAVCVLAGSGFAVAQQGVVRISDTGATAPTSAAYNPAGGPGVAYQSSYRYNGAMPGQPGMPATPVSYDQNWSAGNCYPQATGSGVCGSAACAAECGEGCLSAGACPTGFACDTTGSCDCYAGGQSYGYCDVSGSCQSGNCQSGNCQSGVCHAGGGFSGQHVCGCNPCQCDPCQCHTGGHGSDCFYGDGYRQRMCTLFAQPIDTCSGSRLKDCWRGHQVNYLRRNQRLANHLFGWLIPSGSCGQGTPPVGKYHITYADQPDYADPRDGQLYAAQGYGMPITVPTAPTVRYAYNYSWGTPASRLTPLSTYNPQTSPQPLYHQSW